MSILNDDRRFSSDEEEYAEWKSEMISEYRRQEAYDRECEREYEQEEEYEEN